MDWEKLLLNQLEIEYFLVKVAQRHSGLTNSFGRIGTCERALHELHWALHWNAQSQTKQ